MKRTSIITILFILVSNVQAQPNQPGTISGSIKDSGQQTINASLNVSLLRAKDSSTTKSIIANNEGNFIFENVKFGNYIVLVSLVGHSKTYTKSFSVSPETKNISLGILKLLPQYENLKSVTVLSKKVLIENKFDRTVFNVDASIGNAGSTALEILEKSPGVSVDKDGNISLIGKQGVEIMIDGKPTFLSNAELSNMLRNMSSNQLDQIEIMTNPSAKYDASGRSGIINIKTKKNKQTGFNGNISTVYTQGIYAKTNNSITLNYRNKKLNVFSTLSANDRKSFQSSDIFRQYIHNDGSTQAFFDQKSYSPYNSANYNAKIGIDYYISRKNTFGIVVTGTTNPFNNILQSTTNLKDSLNVLDSIVKANSIRTDTWKNIGLNINYRHSFDSSSRELTGDLDYLTYSSNQNQISNNSTYSPLNTLLTEDNLKGITPSLIYILSAKIDYLQSLKYNMKFEAGLKSSYVKTDNSAGYFNTMGSISTPDWTKSNQFNYKENINAAYINLRKEIHRLSIQAGLRAENTNYSGITFGNPTKLDSSFKKSYINLFPTLYLGYNYSENTQLGFSFGKRINRPDYQDLNPFLSFIDKYTYLAGNPFLRPMYSNIFQFSHTYKKIITTRLNYSFTRDLFAHTLRQEGFASIQSEGNFGRSYDASISMNLQFPMNGWWNFTFYHELRYNKYNGLLYNANVEVDATSYALNINNQFTFKKGWSAEVAGLYRSKILAGQIIILGLGQLNTTIQKQILNTKGTLKISLQDGLNTSNAQGYFNFQNTQATFKQKQDNRSIVISFSYRFGFPIKGVQNNKAGGAGDEQNRVKGGN